MDEDAKRAIIQRFNEEISLYEIREPTEDNDSYIDGICDGLLVALRIIELEF